MDKPAPGTTRNRQCLVAHLAAVFTPPVGNGRWQSVPRRPDFRPCFWVTVCVDESQNSSTRKTRRITTPFGTTPVPRFLRGERASVSPASVARRTSLAYGCVHARRWKRQVANPRRTHRRHIGLVQETVACPLSRSHQSDGALRRSSGRANGDGNCFGSTTPAADIQPLLRAHDEPGCRNRLVLSDS